MAVAHASFTNEQPVDLSYVTKGRGIPQTANLSDDKVWVRPLPSCATLPPLPRAEAVSPEDYLGECDCGACVSPCRCGCARAVLWLPSPVVSAVWRCDRQAAGTAACCVDGTV